MTYATMYSALENARDAFAAIPGVQSSKIGLEKNMSPIDYPMVRVVPTRLTPGRPYGGRAIQAFIYFGAPITGADGLELVYATLSALEADILEVLRTIQGKYVETVTDEDRIDTYKIMAIQCELAAPEIPHIRCAMYGQSVSVALSAVLAAAAPFSTSVQETSVDDWEPDTLTGSITRLLNGASSTRTRLTVNGWVAGEVGEVIVGVYADGVLVGNRSVVATSSTAVEFAVTVTHSSSADTTYDLRAVTNASETYTFSNVSFVAQAV